MKRTLISSLVVVVALVATMGFTATADTTVTVSGDTAAGENLPGWMFNRDLSTQTPFEFNTDEASIGTGSLFVDPIENDVNGDTDKFIAELFHIVPIADIEQISYDFMIALGGAEADEVHFYMNVYMNFEESDDTKFYDCRYNIVPTNGVVGSFATVTFDPTQAYDVTTRGGVNASPHPCPAIPADMDNEGVGANIRAIALNVGDTSGSDVGVSGYLDNVIVDDVVETTTYDFEPEPADTDMDTVTDESDLCDENVTTSDEETWDKELGQNRWQLNNDFNWEQGTKKGDPEPDGRTIHTTYGCSGQQILDLVSGLTDEDMSGHYKFGLSSSVLAEFIEDGKDGVIDGYNMESPSDSLVVDSANMAGTNSNIVLENGTDYKVMSSGEWTNRPGETVDTSYVTMDGWGSHTDAPVGGYPADLLELQINADPLFHDWGAYSGAHEYMLMWTGNGAVANFRVFDGDVGTNTPNPGWYGDNVGSLEVDIFEFLY